MNGNVKTVYVPHASVKWQLLPSISTWVLCYRRTRRYNSDWLIAGPGNVPTSVLFFKVPLIPGILLYPEVKWLSLLWRNLSNRFCVKAGRCVCFKSLVDLVWIRGGRLTEPYLQCAAESEAKQSPCGCSGSWFTGLNSLRCPCCRKRTLSTAVDFWIKKMQLCTEFTLVLEGRGI